MQNWSTGKCFANAKSFPAKQLLLCGKYRNVVLKAKPLSEQQQAEKFSTFPCM